MRRQGKGRGLGIAARRQLCRGRDEAGNSGSSPGAHLFRGSSSSTTRGRIGSPPAPCTRRRICCSGRVTCIIGVNGQPQPRAGLAPRHTRRRLPGQTRRRGRSSPCGAPCPTGPSAAAAAVMGGGSEHGLACVRLGIGFSVGNTCCEVESVQGSLRAVCRNLLSTPMPCDTTYRANRCRSTPAENEMRRAQSATSTAAYLSAAHRILYAARCPLTVQYIPLPLIASRYSPWCFSTALWNSVSRSSRCRQENTAANGIGARQGVPPGEARRPTYGRAGVVHGCDKLGALIGCRADRLRAAHLIQPRHAALVRERYLRQAAIKHGTGAEPCSKYTIAF
jgi:hypothetical protein